MPETKEKSECQLRCERILEPGNKCVGWIQNNKILSVIAGFVAAIIIGIVAGLVVELAFNDSATPDNSK